MIYRNAAEMEAAIGTVEDNDFIHQVRRETEEFAVFSRQFSVDSSQ
jgi:hypothetical protein